MQNFEFIYERDKIPLPSAMQRTPVRPLGGISDIAAEELPQRIAEGEIEELSDDAEKIIRLHRADFLRNIPEQAKASLLDCSMIESAIVNGGAKPGPLLCALTNTSAAYARSMAGLTYEGVVHANPESDPRVFTAGENGRSELFFYRIHRQIEFALARTVGLLATTMAKHTNAPDCIEKTRCCIERMQEGFQALMRDLPREDFNTVRPFFANTHRGEPGPSGLFSAGILAFDTLLAGKHPLMQRFNKGKLRQAHCYAQHGMHADQKPADSLCGMDDIVVAENTVETRNNDYLRDSHVSLDDRISIARSMVKARSMHMGVLTSFIPELKRGTGGVAGKDIMAFVEMPRIIYADIADTLSAPL